MNHSPATGDEPALPPAELTQDEPQLGGESALEEIRRIIQSGSDEHVNAALHRLIHIPGPAADHCLIQALDHPSPEIQSLAAVIFFKRPSEESAIALLKRFPASTDKSTQMFATSLAYHYKIIQTESLLIEIIQAIAPLVSGSNHSNILVATQVLKNASHPAAIPALLIAIRHPDGHIHGSAWAGLKRIFEANQDEALRSDVLADLYSGVAGVSAQSRRTMARLIGELEGVAGFPQFHDWLKGNDPIWQAIAIDAVAEVASLTPSLAARKYAIRLLGEVLSHVDAPLRGLIIRHFNHLNRTKPDIYNTLIQPYLITCLTDQAETEHHMPPITIGEAAANVLARIDTPQAQAALEQYHQEGHDG